MAWFGWLTKGRCEVSMLDASVAVGEAFALFIIFFVGLVLFQAVRSKFVKWSK